MLQRALDTAMPEPTTGPGPVAVAPAPSGHSAFDWARRAAGRLTPTDRAALAWWGAAFLALLTAAWVSAWSLHDGAAHAPLTGGIQQWDANLYQSIARYGYFGGPDGTVAHPNQVAFFPGYPLALAAVHVLVRNWVASEVLLSLAAGPVAVVSLARLARNYRAAQYLLLAPSAVFLLVGYSESLFLACAIPAWLAAGRGRWWLAGALGFAAGLVRVNGLFLLAGLATMALCAPHGPRWRALARLSPALLAPAAYGLYLRAATGTWGAWMTANREGWGLTLTAPWTALRNTWRAAFEHRMDAAYALEYQLELGCMAVAVATVVVLLARRQWPEAVYVGATFGALACQSVYQSVPRSLALAFPLFVLLARTRWRVVPWAYAAVGVVLAVHTAEFFSAGRWSG